MKLKPEQIQAWTGFEPMTTVIPVQCSNNWAIKAIVSCSHCHCIGWCYNHGIENTDQYWCHWWTRYHFRHKNGYHSNSLRTKNTLNFSIKPGHLNVLIIKVARIPQYRLFFELFAKSILSCLSQFDNTKWGLPNLFLSYKHLKLKLRLF